MKQNLEDIQNVFFIGIGGIGMSALARYFKFLGKNVAGYDKTPSKLTDSLVAEGIPICFVDDLTRIEDQFLGIKNTLVVFTPAIPKEHSQLNYFITKGFDIRKRAELLGDITNSIYTLAVAGTHGKTTTTTILAHLLKESGAPVTAFLGGISENYGTNLILQGNEVAVVEADEFDRSFLRLSPNIVAITSMDADHLDIYGEAEELTKSFEEFSAKASDHLLVKNGLPLKGITFGVEDDAQYCAINVRIENGSYIFDLRTPSKTIKDLHLNLPGKHNLLNAITAFAMALLYGSPTESLAKALSTFTGVERRFSYIIKTDDLVFIDDYAHHPTEIQYLYEAIREMHPGKRIVAVFQPHLYSRTRDFGQEFAKSLEGFDKILLLDIYPARELPIPDITSSWLLHKIDNEHKELVAKNELIKKIKQSAPEVLVTIGAGDIGAEVSRIKEALVL
ncbi:UDP-N-acetylmuramate--L-alanine ligase [Aquimarina brevivitae]|uniref:UDP-N-acetylmuramate--L-alanine ligase n=1 Tax=Aquimarina brevivitae TaxID=323412 RepID=A0A4Q7P0K9_9FLAO|nr:UDP-N-acetylmuramate--L-alanine ligase [Aquimarina brevivitae]RZS92182.1 UDP-N-acetylmuramate--L-alanine ligase [Aquimarina brevivitae]